MPTPDPRTIAPDPRTRWRCPCGYEGDWNEIRGHRQGYKKRPECRGKIVKVWDPSEEEPLPTPPTEEPIESAQPSQPIEPSEPVEGIASQPSLEDYVPGSHPYEYIGSPEDLFGPEADPETVAEILNRMRGGSQIPPPGGNGHDSIGAVPQGAIPEGGEFRVESSPQAPHITETRLGVMVPPIVLIMFDWAKGQGWNQGRGDLSSFVVDMLLDHFFNCMGMGVFVVSRKEVKLGSGVK